MDRWICRLDEIDRVSSSHAYRDYVMIDKKSRSVEISGIVVDVNRIYLRKSNFP
jgi:hypothetical protein